MAKILNENFKKVPEYQLVCKHCGCLAQYQKRELNFFEDCYDEDLVSYTCPNCWKETVIHQNNLPKPCNLTETNISKKSIFKKNISN